MTTADYNADFQKLRIKAAREFVQTMILVDDEAEIVEDNEPTKIRRPDRKSRSKAQNHAPSPEIKHARQYGLRIKEMMDRCLELGLICSVIRPKEQEREQESAGTVFRNRVVKASRVADIVCLDWEIYEDGGNTASAIIHDILREDDESNGRVRLIAIYTGDTRNTEITKKIYNRIPKQIREKQKLLINEENDLEINGTGIKVVCLFKKNGTQILEQGSNQLEESEVPERLQEEFSALSTGLLSNVALATIASIRGITHRVLAQFPDELDGPWLHHRVMLPNQQDSEEYAVNVVLSEIKGAIDIRNIGERHAGKDAIAKRVREIAKGSMLHLHFRDEHGKLKSKDNVDPDMVIQCIEDGGFKVLSQSIFGNSEKHNMGKCKKHFTSLFSCQSLQDTCDRMNRFAALTSIRNHPKKTPSSEWLPMLGLGTIICQNPEDEKVQKEYFLCLQASCDSVRITSSQKFIFVKLEAKREVSLSNPPEHVVPTDDTAEDYIGMSIPSKESYQAMTTIEFKPSPRKEVVEAILCPDSKRYIFTDSKMTQYVWVADLKRRRALRVAQNLAKQMGRLGFDEFEPYRRN